MPAATVTWRDVRIPELGAVVRVFGPDKPVTVFDLRHADALAGVNWEFDKLRVHVGGPMQSAMPGITGLLRDLGRTNKKVSLAELVLHLLEGVPVRAEGQSHCIVPFNYQFRDVRVRNLRLMPGQAKNYRSPLSSKPPPGVSIGMEFLPRGISMCVPPSAPNSVVMMVDGLKACQVKLQEHDKVHSAFQACLQRLPYGWREQHDEFTELCKQWEWLVRAGMAALDT